MAQTRMTVVICYDIARHKLRRRVSAILEDRMVRVQKSVFECQMTLKAANRLFDWIEGMIDDGDRARMYVMTREGLKRSRAAGGTPLPEDGAFWLL